MLLEALGIEGDDEYGLGLRRGEIGDRRGDATQHRLADFRDVLDERADDGQRRAIVDLGEGIGQPVRVVDRDASRRSDLGHQRPRAVRDHGMAHRLEEADAAGDVVEGLDGEAHPKLAFLKNAETRWRNCSLRR